MLTYKFAILIISHGRPDNIPTITALKKSNYSGDYYIIIDDEDKTSEKYLTNYPGHVIIFCKQNYINSNSLLFNTELRSVAVHARNAAENIAKELNLDYYILLDDDITNFHYRYVDDKLHSDKLDNIDSAFNAYIKYMSDTNISTIGLAHDGMFLGGNTQAFNAPQHSRNRILANAFIRNMKYDVQWGPDMCEDFITSINENNKANIWITLPFIGIHCKKQGMKKSKSDGGNSEAYLMGGNYGVAKYAVLAHPDCYELSSNLWFRCVSYDTIVPKIISCKYKVGDYL